ncbi:MAG: hypothetical protein GOV00_00375, partial [Candidatus Altiarchaeota archaeon]|nr:hypothetical protein [Candidatus Altiarchaeota archaeon]
YFFQKRKRCDIVEPEPLSSLETLKPLPDVKAPKAVKKKARKATTKKKTAAKKRKTTRKKK